MNPLTPVYTLVISASYVQGFRKCTSVVIDQFKLVTLKFLKAMSICITVWVGRRASDWSFEETWKHQREQP